MLKDFDSDIPAPAHGWSSYVVPQGWDSFTAEDHAVWDLLFARQVELLGTRVVAPFLDGIDLLRLSTDRPYSEPLAAFFGRRDRRTA